MENEQKLIDICFEIALTIHRDKSFNLKSREEIAKWVAKQLRVCGFDTQPVGASWGKLKHSN